MMYQKLDAHLTECSDERCSEDYWYDNACIYADQLLEAFTQKDWKELKSQAGQKTLMWKKRLIYCLGSYHNDEELEIIMNLIQTKDEELFVMCIDALRQMINHENKETIPYEGIVERVKDIMLHSGAATKKMLEIFLLQINA